MSALLSGLGVAGLIFAILAICDREWMACAFWCAVGLIAMSALEVLA